MTWRRIKAYLWAVAGNSRTLLLGYGLELAGALDEAKYYDWSTLFGAERAGRVVMAIGIAVIFMRVITKAAVVFKPLEDPNG